MVLLNVFSKRTVLRGKNIQVLVILVRLIPVQRFFLHFLRTESWNGSTHDNKAMQLISNMALIHIFLK